MPLLDFLARTNMNPTVFFLILALCILPNLWSIWHLAKHYYPTPSEWVMWLGLQMFVPVIGGLIYIFVGRKRAIQR